MRGGRGTASARGRLVAESVEDLSQASVLVGLQAAGAGHDTTAAHPFTGVGFTNAHFFFCLGSKIPEGALLTCWVYMYMCMHM